MQPFHCHLEVVDFPWDTTRASDRALFNTFCVPSLAGLLARTGEFQTQPRSRWDGTCPNDGGIPPARCAHLM
jgi:hypothetical protein